MPKRLLYALGAILLLATVVVVVWQGSFSSNFFVPDDPTQTFIFYALSVLIFLLMLTLGFMLVRIVVKLWIERQHNRLGSRIRTKLVFGALALSVMPVFFMVLFSYYVLNNTLQKWFNRPEEHELVSFNKMAGALERETQDTAKAEAELLGAAPEVRAALGANRAPIDPHWLDQFCQSHHVLAASIIPTGAAVPAASCGAFPRVSEPPAVVVQSPIQQGKLALGTIRLAVAVPVDVAAQEKAIVGYDREFLELSKQRREIRSTNLQLLFLIALFILFIATWLAYYLARQITGPISALLQAAEEVSKGHLSYRVTVNAVDELAQLVGGFNRMTADLEANRGELESRRRFTEAILESIPTGVISVDSSGLIQRVNKALEEIFPAPQLHNATRLDELFSREDTTEIRYLMNRALRTGHAARQFEIRTAATTLHLAITVAAIVSSSGVAGRRGSGFVIVIEDTSDLLRAQKAAAWSEVARRVAHEIKNPLTPIALSAERILRVLSRHRAFPPSPSDGVLRECAEIILEETASVKRLVDEFSQFSRLPAAQPVLCDLNSVVSSGVSVFEGRLEGIEVQVDLAPDLPPVFVDVEQFKRVVVNLIDNAAEAMQEVPAKFLLVQTRAGAAETVELTVADTGCGVTPDQKEKLFLPYFSTKGRGTGLGLAIVSHILAEHNASVRVEDNRPCGAVFTVEVPAVTSDKPAVASDKPAAPALTAIEA
jgi:PAS domain S-box-containing protein